MSILRPYKSSRAYAVGMRLQDKKRAYPPIELVSPASSDVINGVKLERWVVRGASGGCVTVDERLMDLKFDEVE